MRAILRRNRLWANVQPDVKMLPTRDDIGQATSHEQQAELLEECSKNRSRSLYPAVSLALSTGMRYSEIRLLQRPEHYVSSTEKCGAAGDDFRPYAYATGPSEPIGDWKEA